MQHSAMTLFCDECGLANDTSATHCMSCQQPLARTFATPATPSSQIAPMSIAPPAVQEVSTGSPLVSGQQGVLIDFQPGTILIERYQIEEEVGRGGFSIVYRAVNLNRRKQAVAIKRIQLSALTPRQVIDATETFNREVLMLSRFNGMPGVPQFYEHFTDAENWYLVMEYIQGATLEEHLQKTRGGYFDEEETIRIGIQLAQILQELHRDNPPVIFRDVKPANIMLTPGQELFLVDFGIARNFTFGKARDTTPLGSPGYAPPEQYGRAQTDRKADIYGLGATLQTLVTGCDPLELAANDPPRNPKPPSPALRTLLDEMLSSDTMQRPVDMLHVQTRLEKCVPENIHLAQTIQPQSPSTVAPRWWDEITSDSSSPNSLFLLILGAVFWFMFFAPFRISIKFYWLFWFTLGVTGILCITLLIRSKWSSRK